MQLGARWQVGAKPHSGVPLAMYEAIAQAEAEHDSARSWTLTWLEGRPRAELFGDAPLALAEVVTDAHGHVRMVGTRNAAPGQPTTPHTSTVDDDDDWLA